MSVKIAGHSRSGPESVSNTLRRKRDDLATAREAALAHVEVKRPELIRASERSLALQVIHKLSGQLSPGDFVLRTPAHARSLNGESRRVA